MVVRCTYIVSGDAVLFEQGVGGKVGVVGLEEDRTVAAAAEENGLLAGRVVLDKVREVVDLPVEHPQARELLLREGRSQLFCGRLQGLTPSELRSSGS